MTHPIRAIRGALSGLVPGTQTFGATNLPEDKPWATPLAWTRNLGLTNMETLLINHGATQ